MSSLTDMISGAKKKFLDVTKYQNIFLQHFFLTAREKLLVSRKKILRQGIKMICHYNKKTFSWHHKGFL